MNCSRCTSEDRIFRIKTSTDLVCFHDWIDTRREERKARRAELYRLLISGVTLRETLPSGVATDWSLDTFTGDWLTTHDSEPARVSKITGGGCEPLAAHLEGREYAFRTTLEAYCLTCGEELVPVTMDADRADDPNCPACATKLAALAALPEGE